MTCLLSFTNWLDKAGVSLSASSEAAQLSAANLREPSLRARWRTIAGVVTPSLAVDLGQAREVGVLALAQPQDAGGIDADGDARGWMASTDTVRHRLSAAAMPAPMVALSTDSNAGATLGANTTRVGPVEIAGGALATAYTSSSTSNSFVRAPVVLAANTQYRVSVSAQRISGTGTTGNIISAQFHNGTGAANATLSMSALPASGPARLSVTFTNVTAQAGYGAFFFADTGNVGQVALWDATIEVVAAGDTDLGPASGGWVPGFGIHALPLSAPVSARYWRTDLRGCSKRVEPGFLDIGRAWIGPAWRPSRNFAYGGVSSAPDSSRVQINPRSLLETVDVGAFQRVVRFDLASLSRDEAEAVLPDFRRAVGTRKQVLFIPYPDSPDTIGRQAIIGRLAQVPAITHENFAFHSAAFELRETV
ncbi:MAG TPA: hypothetical protein VGN96_03955 [Roseococcus sp.]|jgi:hypothetical protein|nr:hypothetical protein [Roseococcus sp.]